MVKFGLFSFFINDFLKRQYPETYHWLIIYGSHKIIYFVSTVQIMTKKINNYFVPFLRNKLLQVPFLTKLFTNKNDNDNNNLNAEFIYNENVSRLANINEITKEKISRLNLFFSYDFIIYSKYNVTSQTTDKIIFYKFPNKEDFMNYEVSNIKFILSEVVIGDKLIKIDFKSDSYNYYVVNNVFEQRFLKYFVKKYYFDEIKDIENMEEKLDSMSLKIIDHNASTETFDKENILKICKQNYKKIHLL
jgi:hypothetical protein